MDALMEESQQPTLSKISLSTFRVLTAALWSLLLTTVILRLFFFIAITEMSWWQGLLWCIPLFAILYIFFRHRQFMFLVFFNLALILFFSVIRFYLLVAPDLPL